MREMHPPYTPIARPSRRLHARRKLRKAWVVACSCVIAAFTTFVLLDAFVIERVGQTVQEADMSNIIAAQENESAESSNEEAASDDSTASNAGAVERPSADDGGDSAEEQAISSALESDGGGHGGPGGKHRSVDAANRSVESGRAADAGDADGSVFEEGAGSTSASGSVVGTYSDENMSITVSKVRAYDTDIYVADIQVTSAEYLKTALAQNAYGRNLKDKTSSMAEAADAVLAINGDYYGFRDDGYVVRNGVLYRDAASAGTDALVIYGDGTMASASQDDATAQQLVEDGAWQVLSFGPTLVDNGELAVTAGDEVDQARGSNPRTAIGMVDSLHYIAVVSDGRTGDNAGLSLYQLAQVMLDNGAAYAYNLDGGGSSTMWFQGEVLNDPGSGNRSGEREVSDIVYFG